MRTAGGLWHSLRPWRVPAAPRDPAGSIKGGPVGVPQPGGLRSIAIRLPLSWSATSLRGGAYSSCPDLRISVVGFGEGPHTYVLSQVLDPCRGARADLG